MLIDEVRVTMSREFILDNESRLTEAAENWRRAYEIQQRTFVDPSRELWERAEFCEGVLELARTPGVLFVHLTNDQVRILGLGR